MDRLQVLENEVLLLKKILRYIVDPKAFLGVCLTISFFGIFKFRGCS